MPRTGKSAGQKESTLALKKSCVSLQAHPHSELPTRLFFFSPCYPIGQRSPTVLAPGTGFVEDKFSTEVGGWGMVQAVMPAVGSSGERWGVVGGGRRSFTRLPATHLLLCGPVPKRLRTGSSPQPGSWGPV